MPLFTLSYANAEECELVRFPIRTALTAEDYIVDLLLTEKATMLDDVLHCVVLVDAAASYDEVIARGFDADSESVVYETKDSGKLFKITVESIMRNLAKATYDEYTWKLCCYEEREPCPSLGLSKAGGVLPKPKSPTPTTSEVPWGVVKKRKTDDSA